MFRDYLITPIGLLEINCSDEFLVEINYVDERQTVKANPLTTDVKEQLEGYFYGNRKQFDLPLKIEGTSFQRKVLEGSMTIPYGKTLTYKALAEKIKHPNAYRAVGNALNQNKIPIIIPCHRIIGSNGNLTGYAGGLSKKEYLLTHEKKQGC
jgi:O-6-methylguanine DNA methyltransferase